MLQAIPGSSQTQEQSCVRLDFPLSPLLLNLGCEVPAVSLLDSDNDMSYFCDFAKYEWDRRAKLKQRHGEETTLVLKLRVSLSVFSLLLAVGLKDPTATGLQLVGVLSKWTRWPAVLKLWGRLEL